MRVGRGASRVVRAAVLAESACVCAITLTGLVRTAGALSHALQELVDSVFLNSTWREDVDAVNEVNR
jgi:hypothetical protein